MKIIRLITGAVLFIALGCTQSKLDTPMPSQPLPLNSPTLEQISEQIEFFSDSTEIGSGQKYKITLSSFRRNDSTTVDILLLRKSKEHWLQLQKIRILKDGITNCDPQISDFNNDGFNDFTFRSATAARGANEMRTLLLFDAPNERLVEVRNSANYPNLRYNPRLNCIDSWRIFGGTSTVFLRIDNDSLREFAEVSLFENLREVHAINSQGKRKLLTRDTINDLDVDVRYTNFNPLETE